MFKSANVTVMVTDLQRAVLFYTGTLGLELKAQYGEEFAEVAAPGVAIGLHPSGRQGPQPGQSGSLSIGLEVDDLEAAMTTLRERGVRFAPHIAEDGPVRLAFFGDPDHNPLYLVEQRPWSG
jgi:catechol 2,3-dioxygenase-like lactoylglutathione lyase family enzyme